MNDGHSLRPRRSELFEPLFLFRAARAAIVGAVHRAIAELRSSRALRWETAAFAGALLVYALTRFWRLADYPIAFFGDEAYQPVAAEELLRNGFRTGEGQLFPVYFLNDGFWVPLLPVWAHVFSVALFGKSIEVARGTAAAFTLLGAAAVGLTLKCGFRTRLWWAGPLFLACTPAFFLHSRTTFETVFSASFYACFILFYVLYRCRSPSFLYPAILFAACAFYSYSVGQVVVAVAVSLLFIVDIRYHLRHWRHLSAGLVLLGIAGLPLYRLASTEPGALAKHLDRVQSSWREEIPPQEKLLRAAKAYGRGLSPRYWFFSHREDIDRHAMAGYGNIRKEELPLVVLGLAVCLWRIRSASHRTVVICTLAAVSGAAVTTIHITRVLSFVIPVSILAVLGTTTLIDWFRAARLRWVLRAAVFALLTAASFELLADSLANGALWYRDYAWGQQWGAKQLFEIIPQYLRAEPSKRVKMTSDWANGADLFPRFFLKWHSPEAARVSMGGVTDFSPENLGRQPQAKLEKEIARLPETIFVMTPRELETARSSGAFSDVQVDRVLAYPDGKPGFYFARLSCSPGAVEELVARGRAKLRNLIDGQVVVDGESLPIRHSRVDIGSIQNIFDGDVRTLARFNAANPAIIEIRFPRPRAVRKIGLTLSSGNWEINVHLSSAGNAQPQSYSAVDRSEALDPRVEIPIDRGPAETAFLRVEIHLMDAGDFAIVHVRELQLR